MAFTTPQDVRDAYEGDIPADRDTWLTGRIAAAERIVASYVGDLDAWVGVDFDRAALLRDVVAGMVLRLVRNPDALTQQSETVGPASYTASIDPRAASGTLWVTDDDLRLLGVNTAADMPRTVRARSAWW